MNNHRKNFLIAKQLCSLLLLAVFIAASALAQNPTTVAKDNRSGASREASRGAENQLSYRLAQAPPARRAGFSLMPSSRSANTDANSLHTTAASPPAVHGTGTVGSIPLWVDTSPSGNSILGDSTITQLNGNIGIGLTTPTSKLTVQGVIETTLGGYKFPDGTVQTTAFNPSQVVRSLNGLTGNVSLAAGANITITPSGNTLTIAAAGVLTGVAHDTTLQGNGTQASPLGVAVPLNLTGSVAIPNAIIIATNTNTSGFQVDESAPIGLKGISASGIGVDGTGTIGVRGFGSVGVEGRSINDVGVFGRGEVGVQGEGRLRGVLAIGKDNSILELDGGAGVWAFGGDSSGVGSRGGVGILAKGSRGFNGAANGLAGDFIGDVDVQGKLTKTAGTFKIDHPLDPENKYLYHSFVESPDMMNIYNGNIATDQNGEAVVEMPDYFDALNKDFRYQLTVMGQFAQAIVASKMKDNRFVIKTTAPNVEVSWQVTGIRHDAYAEKNRVQVEENKTEKERGTYLHPEVFNQPEEKSVEWVRHPEMMKRLKQQRVEAEEKSKKQQQ